jgi:hypothetical protein
MTAEAILGIPERLDNTKVSQSSRALKPPTRTFSAVQPTSSALTVLNRTSGHRSSEAISLLRRIRPFKIIELAALGLLLEILNALLRCNDLVDIHDRLLPIHHFRVGMHDKVVAVIAALRHHKARVMVRHVRVSFVLRVFARLVVQANILSKRLAHGDDREEIKPAVVDGMVKSSVRLAITAIGEENIQLLKADDVISIYHAYQLL